MAKSDTTAASAKGDPPAETARAASRRYEREEFHPLPLRIAARIASGTARLGDLLRLEPGGLVTTETPVGEPSRLVVEGVPVGRGELLEIKGRIAFRITNLGDGDD